MDFDPSIQRQHVSIEQRQYTMGEEEKQYELI